MATKKKAAPSVVKTPRKLPADKTISGLAGSITDSTNTIEIRLRRIKDHILRPEEDSPEKDLTPSAGSSVLEFMDYADGRLKRILNLVNVLEHIVGLVKSSSDEPDEEDDNYFEKLAKESR